MSRSWFSLLLSLGAASPLLAQRVPDSVLVSALASRTSGPGGCFGDLDTTAVLIPFFPEVHFLAATCILEHGDPFSAIVGRDDSGALYLFGDKSSLQFLLDRHAPPAIDPKERAQYAQVLLELSGLITRQAVRLDSLAQLPPAGQRALGRKARQVPTAVWAHKETFAVRLALATLAFDTERIEWWSVQQFHPRVVLIESSGVWEGKPITRFALPRTPADSALAALAHHLSRNYGELHAASSQEDATGLKGLFALTPLLNGAAASLHLDILFEQLALWRQKRFTRVLRTQTSEVQRAVVAQMVQALGSTARWEDLPDFTALARSLGFRMLP